MVKITKNKAIRRFCIYCQGGNMRNPRKSDYEAVKDCLSTDCLFYPRRLGKVEEGAYGITQTIEDYCRHCNGWGMVNGRLDPKYEYKNEAINNAKTCEHTECEIWAFGLAGKRKKKAKKRKNSTSKPPKCPKYAA